MFSLVPRITYRCLGVPAPGFAVVCLLAGPPPTLAQPAIGLSADTVLIDEPVAISISGLPPLERVALRMIASSRLGTWVSSADFEADAEGRVQLTTDAPLAGAYAAVDPMGLFWSAEQDTTAAPDTTVAPNAQSVRLTADIDGSPVAEATLVRLVVRPGVRVTPVRTEELIATFFVPAPSAGAGPYPALLVLGGSECGIQSAESKGAALASHGFAALALAYCNWPGADGEPEAGMESLPQGLSLVPLERVERGLTWLEGRAEVDPSRLGVWGGSKGAELALLVAASNSRVRAAVAYVPSHVVWQGLVFRGGRKSSWSRDGQPVPFLPFTLDESRIRRYMGGGPRYITHLYRASLDDSAAVARAAIPVERINGPVLLVSGGDDLLWPSAYMAERLVERLESHQHPHPVVHLSYGDAGHAIGRPYRPTTSLSSTPNFALGGHAGAYAAAERDSWPKVLRFLRESLGTRSP